MAWKPIELKTNCNHHHKVEPHHLHNDTRKNNKYDHSSIRKKDATKKGKTVNNNNNNNSNHNNDNNDNNNNNNQDNHDGSFNNLDFLVPSKRSWAAGSASRFCACT